MPEIITGLDIGSSQIKCVITDRQKNGGLEVIAAFRHPSQGFRKGILVDVEDASKTFRELFSEIRGVSKHAVSNVFINSQSEHTKVRISRGISAVSQPDKEIKQEDVDRAIQSSRAAKILPNYKVLHTMVREYLVDDLGDIPNPVGMTGSRVEVNTMIVEAFAPHFDILVQTLNQSGASISGVIFNPLAAARAVLTKKQRELGVMLLDIGSDTTSMVIYEENKPIFAKSFPVGSDYITRDITKGLRIPFHVAEQLKCSFGSALLRGLSRRDTLNLKDIDESLGNEEISKRFLNEIIDARVSDIAGIINHEIRPLREKTQLPGGVVITGGGVKLEGIAERLRQGLGLHVQLGLPDLRHFEFGNQTVENLMDDPEFATVIGLILLNKDDEVRKNINIFDSAKRILKNLLP